MVKSSERLTKVPSETNYSPSAEDSDAPDRGHSPYQIAEEAATAEVDDWLDRLAASRKNKEPKLTDDILASSGPFPMPAYEDPKSSLIGHMLRSMIVTYGSETARYRGLEANPESKSRKFWFSVSKFCDNQA